MRIFSAGRGTVVGGGYVGRVAQWREALISIFRRFSTGVGDISGLGGDWALGYNSAKF